MLTIAAILQPERILLDIPAGARDEEAIFHIASMLKEDPAVADWNTFYAALKSKQPCVAAGSGFEICIPHSRTSAVTGMVMSAARCHAAPAPAAGHGGRHPVPPFIRYLFVIGVPVTLASEYLRIIGAIARIFKNETTEAQLRAAPTPASFLAILTSQEMTL